MISNQRTSRDIVHIIGGLTRGGIETWLVHLFRENARIRDRSILVLSGKNVNPEDGYYHEIEGFGIPIFNIPFTWTGLFVVIKVTMLLTKIRPSVLHSHMSYLSGWYMLSGFLSKVPLKISHYHISYPKEHDNFLGRVYIRLTRILETLFSNLILGSSSLALHSYPKRYKKKQEMILFCSIDLERFKKPIDRIAKRIDLSVPSSAIVLGHIGRFTSQKNQGFVLDIFSEFMKICPDSMLVFIGDGELRTTVRKKAHRMGLKERTVFLRDRSDVAEILKGVIDVFVFPSLYEGLGLALVEAQAAGKPVVYSNTVPVEAKLVGRLVYVLSLQDSPRKWAETISHAYENRVQDQEVFPIVYNSDFNIKIGHRKLEEIYSS